MFKTLPTALLTLVLSAATLADDWIEPAGDVLAVALPLTALTATYGLDDPEGRRALLGSLAGTTATTYALKYSVGRERPDGSNDRSFPSEHSALAFGGASFLQRRYGWEVGLPAYLTAAFVGYSRVEAEKHYVSDVLAGAALAWGVNAALVPASDRRQFALLPRRDGVALAFSARF